MGLWQGYSSFASFSQAVDMDEFLGRTLNEDSFRALMALGFIGSLFSGNDNIQYDMVSGSKLSERYGVSETLRSNYDYLAKRSFIKGTTSYIAFFNGNIWIVVSYKETKWVYE
jgi:hypothetical protein